MSDDEVWSDEELDRSVDEMDANPGTLGDSAATYAWLRRLVKDDTKPAETRTLAMVLLDLVNRVDQLEFGAEGRKSSI